MKSPKDLADAIVGGNVTSSIIENIEVGRKVNLDVSQLLNIAKALDVPPSYLLAPLGRPSAKVDLPNLSEALREMTAVEFDAWLSNVADGIYQPVTLAERSASQQLTALRELTAAQRELRRMEIATSLEQGASPSADRDRLAARADAIRIEVTHLTSYLESAGWVF